MRLHWRQMGHRLAEVESRLDYFEYPRAGLDEEQRPQALANARDDYTGLLRVIKDAVDGELEAIAMQPEVNARLAEPESAALPPQKSAGALPESYHEGG